ncbi:MAG: MarR family transcriptional regulator [Actinomycetota bacterium]|nr:MarR family transcriptional regulator [Actinomycetota bacterium]
MPAEKAFPPGLPDAGASAEWLSDNEQTAWRTMVSVYARLVSRLDAELQAAHAISLRDYEVLVHLSEADGAALRMADLADRLVVSPSGLTRRLDGLVRDGLVKRQACLSDRRGTLAVLSEAGWAALEESAPTHAAGVKRYVFRLLDQDQVGQMTSNLRLMGAALESSSRAAPSDHSRAPSDAGKPTPPRRPIPPKRPNQR